MACDWILLPASAPRGDPLMARREVRCGQPVAAGYCYCPTHLPLVDPEDAVAPPPKPPRQWVWPPALRVVHRADGWYVVGLPDATHQEDGPYKTKAEAVEEMNGSLRHFTDPTPHLIVNGPDAGCYMTNEEWYQANCEGLVGVWE